jgi:TldD protein
MAMPLDDTLNSLVAELERRFPYASALLASTAGVQISVDRREQSAIEQDPTSGVTLTVYDGSSFHELASSDLDPDRLARAVRAWASEIQPTPSADVPAPGTLLGWRDFTTLMQVDPRGVSLADKMAHVTDLQRRAQALDGRIVLARAGYQEIVDLRTYIGRGNHLTERVVRLSLGVVIVVSDGQQTRFHALQRAGTGGYELVTVGDEELRATCDVALRLLEAGRVEPGEYDVVTDPSVTGVIAHESFGHGTEQDLFPKGRALAAQYVNRRVAAPGVDILDDPSLPGGPGSYFFDDEGQLAAPTRIVHGGIFVRPISDLMSATLMHTTRSANGRRQDFTRKVYARMSNTFFGQGEADPAAILGSLERGIYLHQFESGMEDPMGWGVQVTAHYGEEIVNGKPTGRLFTPVAISGYVPDLLQSITMVGDDFHMDMGRCGKGHKEMVITGSGGPHLRMKARLG